MNVNFLNLKVIIMKKKYLLIALSVFMMGIVLTGCYCGRYHSYHPHYYYR